ncbi:hypothetical protein MBLNU457_3667t1 [Dothideomycetes sp. NU457]
MVSFSCEGCGDVLTKKKLDPHRNQCWGASYTCIDCMVHFQGTDYRSHTSCMTEAQKYEGSLYREKPKKGKGPPPKSTTQETAMIPRKAYVEDEIEGSARPSTVAVVDVLPEAPSPPPAAVLPKGFNVFDYQVNDELPKANGTTHYEGQQGDSQDAHFAAHGYSYGVAPIDPKQAYLDKMLHETPAPKPLREQDGSRSDKKSDRKRKRDQPGGLDIERARLTQSAAMSDAPAVTLHSGLTGGLNRLLSRPVDQLELDDQIAPSPSSPLKRSKSGAFDANTNGKRVASESTHKSSRSKYEEIHTDHDEHERRRRHKHRQRRYSSSSDDQRRPSRKHLKAIEDQSRLVEPPTNRQLITYHSPAELFMSFVNKGPESERGVSINKALKRYHREREAHSDKEKQSIDKELFKGLRVRRNDRGEFVLFF